MSARGDRRREKREHIIILTVGSKYRICSVHGKEGVMITEGIFKGYTSIGSDEAICMELSKKHRNLAGKIRVIPTSMILSIDILEEAKAKEDEEEKTAIYFR